MVRALIALLVLPLALAGALPAYAKMASGQATHVCRCEVRGGHSTCSCPICHPDREDFRITEESIRGRCGDDDVVFGSTLDVSIAPAFLAFVAPPSVRALVPRAGVERLPRIFVAPETPPPRAIVA